MLDPKAFEELSAKISAAIAASPAGDIEKNVRAMVASGLARLNLVTREEFDVQREVLAKAREKLAALEARLAEMEARQSDKPRA
jgi:hypothetical protein